MSSPHPPHAIPLDLDDLIARVREEARRKSATSTGLAEPESSGTHLPPLPEPISSISSFARKQSYRLRDFLALPDEHFLTCAYQALLMRAPDDAGLKTYGTHLSNGGNRAFVLASLLWSEEARQHPVRVSGLRWISPFKPLPGKRLFKPVLGAFETLTRAFSPGLGTEISLNVLRDELEESRRALLGTMRERDSYVLWLKDRYEQLERDAADTRRQTGVLRGHSELMEAQTGKLNSRLDGLDSRTRELDKTQQDIVRDTSTLADRIGRLTRDFDFSRSDLIYHRSQLHELIRTLPKASSEQSPRSVDTGDQGALTGNLDPGRIPGADKTRQLDPLAAYYVSFEDAFRGEEEEIRASFSHYLEDVDRTHSVTRDSPLLDLGSGRGEWLLLLREHGVAAAGADANGVMVNHCRERGLDVQQIDAVSYLRKQEDASVGAVSAFHLIEHLPFAVLYELIEQVHRVLRPGGLLLLETPNPENLLVGSHTFYHDPTHRNPLTPTATAFLVRYFGFAEPEIRRLHPYPEEAKVPGNDPLTERVNGHLCGPQDFAVIARKPGPTA